LAVLLLIHILCAGVWLGCVLTETLVERGLTSHRLALAELHLAIDLWIEVPAFLGVAATGLALLRLSPVGALLSIKIGIAAGAILANVLCVWRVWARVKAARQEDWATHAIIDAEQHQVGALTLVGLVLATALGVMNG
jgi:hypothetical protein